MTYLRKAKTMNPITLYIKIQILRKNHCNHSLRIRAVCGTVNFFDRNWKGSLPFWKQGFGSCQIHKSYDAREATRRAGGLTMPP